MTAAIWWEFEVGQNELPAEYSGLFSGQVQRLLKDDDITKYQWLSSVCNTWDHIRIKSGLGGWERNQMAETFIQRHKMRRKRKLEE